MLSERAKETYRWAFMRHAVMARGGPSRATRVMSRLGFRNVAYRPTRAVVAMATIASAARREATRRS